MSYSTCLPALPAGRGLEPGLSSNLLVLLLDPRRSASSVLRVVDRDVRAGSRRGPPRRRPSPSRRGSSTRRCRAARAPSSAATCDVAGLEEARRLACSSWSIAPQRLERPAPVAPGAGRPAVQPCPGPPARPDLERRPSGRGPRRARSASSLEPALMRAQAAAQLLRAGGQPVEPALEPGVAGLELDQAGRRARGHRRPARCAPAAASRGPRRDPGRAVGRLARLVGCLGDRALEAVVAGSHTAAGERVPAGGRAQRRADLLQRLREQRVGLADRHPVERVEGRLGLVLGDPRGRAQRVELHLPCRSPAASRSAPGASSLFSRSLSYLVAVGQPRRPHARRVRARRRASPAPSSARRLPEASWSARRSRALRSRAPGAGRRTPPSSRPRRSWCTPLAPSASCARQPWSSSRCALAQVAPGRLIDSGASRIALVCSPTVAGPNAALTLRYPAQPALEALDLLQVARVEDAHPPAP